MKYEQENCVTFVLLKVEKQVKYFGMILAILTSRLVFISSSSLGWNKREAPASLLLFLSKSNLPKKIYGLSSNIPCLFKNISYIRNARGSTLAYSSSS